MKEDTIKKKKKAPAKTAPRKVDDYQSKMLKLNNSILKQLEELNKNFKLLDKRMSPPKMF